MSFSNDIYFDKNYGKLYEKIEHGTAEIFKYEDENGIIENQYIKTIVPNNINENIYYIITTPYGYGGPRIISCKPNKKADLLNAYEQNYKNFCLNNGIIYEFIRFHPLVNNAYDFQFMYDIKLRRKTLGTNLTISQDPIRDEFTNKCRATIRNSINKGVEFTVKENPSSLYEFKHLYYETMERNNADLDYFFDDDYFDKLLKYYRKNIILAQAYFNGKLIAATISFIYDKIIEGHLNGVLNDYLYLSPASVLIYAIALWGIENGYSIIHHGGGRTADLDDRLYLFKKKFSRNTSFDYYVSEKIWNKEIYNKLYNSLGNKGSLTKLVKQYYMKN